MEIWISSKNSRSTHVGASFWGSEKKRKQGNALVLLHKLSRTNFPVPEARKNKTTIFVRICYTFTILFQIFGTSNWGSGRSRRPELGSSVARCRFLTQFWTLLRARSRYFGTRFSKKRLAWIRTHARLRRSVYGLQAVVATTTPTPRLRFKGCGSRWAVNGRRFPRRFLDGILEAIESA